MTRLPFFNSAKAALNYCFIEEEVDDLFDDLAEAMACFGEESPATQATLDRLMKAQKRLAWGR